MEALTINLSKTYKNLLLTPFKIPIIETQKDN